MIYFNYNVYFLQHNGYSNLDVYKSLFIWTLC